MTKKQDIIISDEGNQFTHKPSNRAVVNYLMSLNTENSRNTQIQSLNRAAQYLSHYLPEDVAKQDRWQHVPWDNLEYEHIFALKTKLKQDYAPATVNVTLAALRKIAEHAYRLELIDSDKYRKIKLVSDIKNRTLPSGRHIEYTEVQRIFAAISSCENTTRKYRDLAIFALLYGTGMRRSEIASLRLANYRPADGEFYLLATKQHKERKVYIDGKAKTHVHNWLEIRGSKPGYFFYRAHKSGKLIEDGISPQAVYDIVKYWSDKANLANVEPHSFRRTYIGELLDAGVDIATIAENVGHEDVNTTAKYDRRGETAQKKSAQHIRMPDLTDE